MSKIKKTDENLQLDECLKVVWNHLTKQQTKNYFWEFFCLDRIQIVIRKMSDCDTPINRYRDMRKRSRDKGKRYTIFKSLSMTGSKNWDELVLRAIMKLIRAIDSRSDKVLNTRTYRWSCRSVSAWINNTCWNNRGRKGFWALIVRCNHFLTEVF